MKPPFSNGCTSSERGQARHFKLQMPEISIVGVTGHKSVLCKKLCPFIKFSPLSRSTTAALSFVMARIMKDDSDALPAAKLSFPFRTESGDIIGVL
jgi:hypothetical protein